MAVKGVSVDRANVEMDQNWLVAWFVLSGLAGFIAGGNLFPRMEGSLFGDLQTSFGWWGAFGTLAAVLVANIPVMVIGNTLLASYVQQVETKSYLRALVEMQMKDRGAPGA